MSFHDWFGRHSADTKHSRWHDGHFVSRCTECGRDMVKPPGQAWQLRESAAA